MNNENAMIRSIRCSAMKPVFDNDDMPRSAKDCVNVSEQNRDLREVIRRVQGFGRTESDFRSVVADPSLFHTPCTIPPSTTTMPQPLI